MHSFTDTAGRSWSVVVDVIGIKQARKMAGVDLMTVLDGADAVGKLADPVVLVDVLWSLLEVQAVANKVGPEDFARSLGGDALDAASNALLGALVDFFPSPRRTILRGILEKTKTYLEKRTALAMQNLEALDMEALCLRALSQKSEAPPPGVSSGNSPALSDATHHT